MVVAFGIDVGSYSKPGHFAWYELTTASESPTPNKACHDPVMFADRVIAILSEGKKIALGLEAPIWMPGSEVLLGKSPRMHERFASEKGRTWYAGAAATVGMMALSVLGDLLARLAVTNLSQTITDDFTHWNETNDSLLLYESFLLTNRKPISCGKIVSDEWDAFVTASLILEYKGEVTHLRECSHPGRLQELQSDDSGHTALWPIVVPNEIPRRVGPRSPLTLAWW
jgi:hypothetical protein